MSDLRIVALGGRGSIPVSGAEFVRYGGNTTCFALTRGDRVIAFFDAGTGLAAYRRFGLELDGAIDVFLTHYHLDHIQGLSMLDELWTHACDIRLHGPGDPGPTVERAISPPLFPVSIASDASITFHPMEGEVVVSGVHVVPFGVNHPQSAIGYRIDGPDRTVAIVTDHEAGSEVDQGIVDALEGVDVVIHDAQYVDTERDAHRGWGHSTPDDAVALARRVGAGRLVLTSHDPRRTDDAIDEILADVRRSFPDVDAVYPGMEIGL